MAIFTFKCPEHGPFEVFLSKGEKIYKCPTCGQESKRYLKIGTVRVTEKVDNGLMYKSLERLANIDELIEERNANHEKSLKED